MAFIRRFIEKIKNKRDARIYKILSDIIINKLEKREIELLFSKSIIPLISDYININDILVDIDFRSVIERCVHVAIDEEININDEIAECISNQISESMIENTIEEYIRQNLSDSDLDFQIERYLDSQIDIDECFNIYLENKISDTEFRETLLEKMDISLIKNLISEKLKNVKVELSYDD